MIIAGTKLGRYEIRSQIGEGGMGEVYRARDEKLNRDVAIKVLPATLSQKADRLRRFEQEAQAAGALNHPNILGVYDVGMHDGAPYVVSELLEGESLRERLRGLGAHTSSEPLSPLPQRKAIEYALQLAHGLAAAHEKGIVHRDLKPDNIFITKDDRIKILDFGLAKLVEQVSEGVAQTEIATRKFQTDPGTVMGTVGYMSPEQVRGRHVDHRSDIFSFGAVLYEMLSSRRAFHGESAVETLNAILKEEPPELTTTNRNIAPALERVVWHCLEKSPERRFQSATDVAFALESIAGTSGVSGQTLTAVTGLTARSRIVKHLPWVVAGLFLLVALASLPFTIAYLRQAPSYERTFQLSLLLPEKSTFRSMTLSPDGRRLAFVAQDSRGKNLLYVRLLDSLAAQPLLGTDSADSPFWSPDSRLIGFFAEGKLKKIEASGGPVQALCNARAGRGGTWNRDGVIVFAPDTTEGLYRVSAAGGEPSRLTTPDQSRQERSHRWPQFLPDGRSFLYLSLGGAAENTGIYVGSLDAKEPKRLLGTDSSAVYAPPGHLLFWRDTNLMAQALDPKKLLLTGEPFLIAEHVSAFTASENGVLAYYSGATTKTQLAWFDSGGNQKGAIGSPGDYLETALSPDGERVAFSQTSNRDIWLLELARGTTSRFTFNPGPDRFPVWSPDGSRIVFSSEPSGNMDLYQKAASGAGSDELLLKSGHDKAPSDWSPDGRFILYMGWDPKTRWDIWVWPLEGDSKPLAFLQTEFSEYDARFSPNGKWIAYTSDESGTDQVYVQSFPASGAKWQVSTDGGTQPRWRRGGRELFYLAADGKLMSVGVKTDGTFEAGVPKPLFEIQGSPASGPFLSTYAVTADGQRFLVRFGMEQASTASITVVVNWTTTR